MMTAKRRAPAAYPRLLLASRGHVFSHSHCEGKALPGHADAQERTLGCMEMCGTAGRRTSRGAPPAHRLTCDL